MPAVFGVWGVLKSAISFSKSTRVNSKTNFYELWAFGDPFGLVGEIISCRTALDWVAFQASSSLKHNLKASQYSTDRIIALPMDNQVELHDYNQGFVTHSFARKMNTY